MFARLPGVNKQTKSTATPGRLVSLELKHGDALETFLSEFDAEPHELQGYFCSRGASIEQAVGLLDASSQGERLIETMVRGETVAQDWVQNSTWFWELGTRLQGVINLRHRLTPALEQEGGHIGYSVARPFRRQGVASKMLDAVLDHCRELGIQQTLLTCSSDNVASIGTIEKHGGVLHREGWSEPSQEILRWYWIDLKNA